MFIGHYGPAFAAKPLDKRIPLWLLFIAVQWMDVWWSGLVLLGIEKLRIIPGFTQGSPFDLYYMPFTHGLIGAIVLSLVLGAIVSRFYAAARLRVLAIVAAAVFSHWLCDLIVHVPDLPLWADTGKVGFGLWRWAYLSVPLEIALMLGGAWLYAAYVPARPGGNVWLWLFAGAMAVLELYNQFAPPPPDPHSAAILTLTAFFALAFLAGLIDRTRAA